MAKGIQTTEEPAEQSDALLRLVRDVAVKVNESTSMRDLLAFVLRTLCEYSGWEAGFAYRRRSRDGVDELHPVAGYYTRPEHASFHDEVMRRAPPLGQAPPWSVGERAHYTTTDIGAAVSSDAAAAARTELRQVTVVPVASAGSVELVLEFFGDQHSALPEHTETGIESVVAQLEHMLRRVRAYRLLERQSQQLRSVLQAAADAILMVRADGVIEDINPAVERLFGVERGRLVGRPVASLLPGLASAVSMERVLETIRLAGGLESDAREASGRSFPVHLTVSEPLADGDASFFILAVRDFSAIRTAQQRQVHQERLAAMGEMMTALAHESRNALQRIQSCLTLLELRGNSEVLSLVDDMQSAQDHLQRLYEEVRAFASPLQLRMERVDLARLAEEVWRELDALAGAKRVAHRVEGAGGSAEIAADGERIGQVMRNVLENAVQASPEGGLVRIVLARETVGGEHYVRVEVRDQGEPIAPDVQRRAFDLLFSTKRGGTGMGLAISRRIVQEHSGEISLHSDGGEGTSVLIRLPVGQL